MGSHIISTFNRKDVPPMAPILSQLATVPIPPINPSVIMFYTAGVVGMPQASDPPAEFPYDDFEQQARNSMYNIRESLALNGGSPADIVKLTWYVVGLDLEKRATLGKVLAEFFVDYDNHKPPSALIGVQRLAQDWFHVEVEAVAAMSVESGINIKREIN